MALSEWLDVIQEQKKMWVESTERGDMYPTVMVFRDGECLCIVTASDMDRDKGLHAAHIARSGLRADALIAIFDSHVKSIPPEEADSFLENYRHGDLQKACDEEGACELGQISDCLTCHWINDKLESHLKILPYAYHGKNGGIPFKWQEFADLKLDSEKVFTEAFSQGVIPEALHEIMSAKPKIDEIPLLGEIAGNIGLSASKKRWHEDRAIFQVFDSLGFVVQAAKKYMEPYSGE